MRIRVFAFCSAAFLCLLLLAPCACIASDQPASQSSPAIPAHPSLLSVQPLDFAPLTPDTFTLANGLKVYFVSDRDVPLVQVRVKIRAGAVYEPAEKIGLASLCGEAMRTGGTSKLSGDDLDETLEYMGAELGHSIGQEAGEAMLDVRAQDLQKGLGILADMLFWPRFEEKKIEVARANRLEDIRRRNDQPRDIARREFYRLVYGKDSPWGRISQPETLQAIERADLLAFHKRYYHPNNMLVGVSGDFDLEEMKSLLEKYFGQAPSVPIVFPEIAPVKTKLQPGVYVVQRDIPQSSVVVGHLGYRRKDPAQLALTLFNELFGYGFTSRLMREVRSNRGLAYSVWGHMGKGTDIGLFRMACDTKAESTVEAAQVLLEEMRKVRAGPIEKGELELARAGETNRFCFFFDSAAKVVSLKMDLDFYGYPEDWMATYVDRVQALSPDDVLQAARRFLNPDAVIALVVGDPEKFPNSLDDLGLGKPQTWELDPVQLPAD